MELNHISKKKSLYYPALYGKTTARQSQGGRQEKEAEDDNWLWVLRQHLIYGHLQKLLMNFNILHSTLNKCFAFTGISKGDSE